MAINVGRLNVLLNADTTQFENKMSRASKSLDAIGKTARKVTKIAGTAFAGLTAVIGTAVNAVDEKTVAQRQLEAAIEGTGKAIDAQNIVAYSSELQNLTSIADSTITSQAALLASFNLEEQQIMDLLPRVANLSKAKGVSLSRASRTVGRALQGNVGSLSRYGIALSDAETEALKLAEGQERINLLLEIFDRSTGPAAERMADTVSGQLRLMWLLAGDVAAEIGRIFEPTVLNLFRNANDILKNVVDWVVNLDDETKEVIKRWALWATAISGVVTGLGALVIIAVPVLKALGAIMGLVTLLTSPMFLGGVAIAGIAYLIYEAWDRNWMGINDKVESFVDGALNAFDSLVEWWNQSDIREIVLNWWDRINEIWTDEDLTLAEKTLETVKLTVNSLADLVDSIINLWLDLTIRLVEKGVELLGLNPDNNWLVDLLKRLQNYWQNEEDIPLPARPVSIALGIITVSKIAGWAFRSGVFSSLASSIVAKVNTIGGLVLGSLALKAITILLSVAAIGFVFGGKKGRNAFLSVIEEAIGDIDISEPITLPTAFLEITAGTFDFGTEGLKNIRNSIQDLAENMREIVRNSLTFEDIDMEGEELSPEAREFFDEIFSLGQSISEFLGEAFFLTLDFAYLIMQAFDGVIDDVTEDAKRIGREIASAIAEGIDDLLPDWIKDLFSGGSQEGTNIANAAGRRAGYSFFSANATGGLINGAGTGTSDSNLALLSNGEYIVNAKATEQFLPLLEMINNSGLSGFASGGLINSIPSFQNGGLNVGGLNLPSFDFIEDLDLENLSKVFDRFGDMIAGISAIIGRAISLIADLLIKITAMVTGVDEEALRKEVDTVVSEINKFIQDLFSGEEERDEEVEPPDTKDLENTMSAWESMLQNITETGWGLLETLQSQTNMGSQLVQAFSSQGLIGVLGVLISNSSSFSKIVEMINPVLQELADIVGIVLLPILKILEPVLKIFSEAIRTVADILIAFWNGLMDLLSKIPFVNMDKYKVSLDDLTDSTEEANREMSDFPKGFRVALEAFEAQTPREVRNNPYNNSQFNRASNNVSRNRGGLITRQNVENVANNNKEINLNINAPVYGMNDFESKVKRIMSRAQESNKMTRLGVRQSNY